MSRRTLVWLVLCAFLMALALRGEAWFNRAEALGLAQEQDAYRELRRLIDDRYVDEVDRKKLFYGALEGMASALDRHTVFWPPERYESEKSSTSGHFGGLGIEIVDDEEHGLTIVTPLADTPAFKAGLLPQDRILAIDGTRTENMDLADASRLLRGPPKSTVVLSIGREGVEQPVDFKVVRDIIKVQSVQEWGLLGAPEAFAARVPAEASKIGYVQLIQFQEESAADLDAAIRRMEAQGMQALILDLRQNPGGLLTSAIDVCDLFLADGKLVSTRARADRDGATEEEVFFARGEGTHPAYPLAVLIDGRSASASEIVAGCMKDRGRAVLVGEKSFGKGSVQTIVPVELGALGEGALKLTTGKYYTPSGESIDGKGIKPDYEEKFGDEELRGLLLGRRKRRLENNDPRRNGGEAPAVPALPPGAEASAEKPFHDTQLEKAVTVLLEQMKPK